MRGSATGTILLAALGMAWSATSPAADAPSFEDAHRHLQRGRYDEALDAYRQLARSDAVRASLGTSRAHEFLGHWSEAVAAVEAVLKDQPRDARLHARMAELRLMRGQFAEAEQAVNEALRLDPDQVLARIVQADLYTERGRLAEASEAYRWFVRYYNQAQPDTAETLMLVARGAVRYARWNQNTQIYNFAVNTLCPDALKQDPDCWQAYNVSGTLLLEKYNREQAIPEFRQALAINPRAAVVYVALGTAAYQQHELEQAVQRADAALSINPQLVGALVLKADVQLARGRIDAARDLAEKARAFNPRDQRTLARLGVCYLLEDGVPPADDLEAFLEDVTRPNSKRADTRFERLVAEILQWNAAPGRFFTDLAELLDSRRQFDAAEVAFQKAIAVMPQLPEPKTALGLLYMRVGKTDEARRILDEAFQADPYHVRVSNMRKVIRLLDGYAVITTDHFVIRVDSRLDQTLGRYMAEYLEEIYDDLVEEFGYEPPQRTQFEVFNRSGGRSAHEWFSARMVGLPWIHTVGASTGVMVALASPTAAKEPFNWARVLKHEFVHVITLQQTNFNIPHWFTEALAVTAEDAPRPELWNRLLLERVPRGEVRNLNTLDEAFQRPLTSDDWQFAYCQSRLYAQYMVETYGQDAIRKMLDAYRVGLPTSKAIERALGVGIEPFEAGYREFLNRTVAELRPQMPRQPIPLKQAELAYRAKTDSPRAAAEYAEALLVDGRRGAARRTAREALAAANRDPLAAVVMARLEILDGDYDRAFQVLHPALDRSQPDRDVLLLLAQVEARRGNHRNALELFELGRKTFSHNLEFLQGLEAAARALNDEPRRIEALRALTEADPDNPGPHLQLAELALRGKNWQEAVRQGKAALYVDVLDANVHRVLGEAWLGLENYPRAVREYETALELKPGDTRIELGAARAHLAADEKSQARTHLQNILRRTPHHPEAEELLKSLD